MAVPEIRFKSLFLENDTPRPNDTGYPVIRDQIDVFADNQVSVTRVAPQEQLQSLAGRRKRPERRGQPDTRRPVTD
jgi:hypothetical protein